MKFRTWYFPYCLILFWVSLTAPTNLIQVALDKRETRVLTEVRMLSCPLIYRRIEKEPGRIWALLQEPQMRRDFSGCFPVKELTGPWQADINNADMG